VTTHLGFQTPHATAKLITFLVTTQKDLKQKKKEKSEQN
jgi:hypothetical protein